MSPSERAARLRMMVLDVDGVLTDGRLYFGPQGEAMKAFDVRDGHGIKLLRAAGLTVALLTARRSDIVAARARELGIELVRQGEADKAAGFARLLADTGVPAAQCGYMGDDWPDLPVLTQAGLAATVANACAECKAIAHWIGTAPAGRGAVRELAEFIVRAQGQYDDLLARHTSGGLHA